MLIPKPVAPCYYYVYRDMSRDYDYDFIMGITLGGYSYVPINNHDLPPHYLLYMLIIAIATAAFQKSGSIAVHGDSENLSSREPDLTTQHGN